MAWQATYGISNKSLGRAWQQMKSGILIIESKVNSSRSQKTDVAVAWMRQFFNCVGDRMPDGVEINLPSYLNFKLLHEYMCEDLAKDGDVAISYTQLIHIMKTDFPKVRIPKVIFICISSIVNEWAV